MTSISANIALCFSHVTIILFVVNHSDNLANRARFLYWSFGPEELFRTPNIPVELRLTLTLYFH